MPLCSLQHIAGQVHRMILISQLQSRQVYCDKLSTIFYAQVGTNALLCTTDTHDHEGQLQGIAKICLVLLLQASSHSLPCHTEGSCSAHVHALACLVGEK